MLPRSRVGCGGCRSFASANALPIQEGPGLVNRKERGGVTFNFTDNPAPDPGCECLSAGDADVNNAEFTAVRSRNAVASLRFMF